MWSYNKQHDWKLECMTWRYKKSTNNHHDGVYKEEDDVSNHRKKARMSRMDIEVHFYIIRRWTNYSRLKGFVMLYQQVRYCLKSRILASPIWLII